MKRQVLSLIVAATMCSFSANAAEKLLIIGDAIGGWSIEQNSVVMLSADGNTFTCTGWFAANAEFKFLTASDWGYDEYRNAGDEILDGTGTLRLNGADTKFKLAEEGNYTIVCDLENLTITATKIAYQDNHIIYGALYLIGDATEAVWELPNAIPLVQNPENYFEFSAEVVLSSEGGFKIATNPHVGYGQKFYYRDENDDAKISEDATDDRKWSVAESGIYVVTVDLLAQTILTTDKSTLEKENVIDNGALLKIDYFTIQGIKISVPEKNTVYIVKKTYQNGKIINEKAIFRTIK
ncbi:MAG: SusF/SusE family outer membrane protein [Prevotellaceae bacterium]|jgi:hypothetical protein|nr:SusF/SusE family outer membrane protein [Prevotellaceae bacterium]